VRLEVPAHRLDLEGLALSAMAFILFDGRAAWDRAGVRLAEDNPPPVCDAGGPYVADCRRGIAQLQIDGTQSRDPGGGELTYAWSTDCVNAAFDDPASPTPVLAVDLRLNRSGCNVNLTVTDRAGLSSTSSTAVTIADVAPPAIRCPGSVVTGPDPGQCSAMVNFLVASTDDCSEATVACSPPSGSLFPVGVTAVECTATDAAGATARCAFTVTVTVGDSLPLPHGFWKNHPAAWPTKAIPMMLGARSYRLDELLAILHAPTAGDASLILARQLITTTLNTANGSDPRPVCEALKEGNRLLSEISDTLPGRVTRSSPAGRAMVNLASLLREYND
jgi:hypothetical protein